MLGSGGFGATADVENLCSMSDIVAEEAEPPSELFLARLPGTPFEVTLRDLIVRLGDYEFWVFHNCEHSWP